MHNEIPNENRDRKRGTVMGNETERKTEHDSQILQVSVMWFKKWRIRPNHNKVLSNFCHQKNLGSIFQ